jgi:hypothetical protein
MAVGSTRGAKIFLRCDETDILSPNRSKTLNHIAPNILVLNLKGSMSTANNYIDRHSYKKWLVRRHTFLQPKRDSREFTCDRITQKNKPTISLSLSLSLSRACLTMHKPPYLKRLIRIVLLSSRYRPKRCHSPLPHQTTPLSKSSHTAKKSASSY